MGLRSPLAQARLLTLEIKSDLLEWKILSKVIKRKEIKMGFMAKWEKWSRRAYDIWGRKLQDRYNFWSEYDDPELRAKCKLIWESMPKKVQKTIHAMVTTVLKQYGPDFAKKIVEELSKLFTDKKPTK